MGTLRAGFRDEWMGAYGLRTFVETGTGHGTGLEYAATMPFEALYSVEIVPEQAAALGSRFAGDPRIHLCSGRSDLFLQDLLPTLPPAPILFWLDAHYPGADLGLRSHDSEPRPYLRLPLPLELEAIAAFRPEGRDLILIDDLRIFERGPNARTDLEAQGLGGVTAYGELAEALGRFDGTHRLVRRWDDEGYLELHPQ